MGFLLTLLYISLALLSPERLLSSLAEYRVELIVILAALFFSIPGALDRRLFRVPQIYLLTGFFIFVFLSVAAGPTHWLGGGFLAVEQFLSLSIAFYLVTLNFRSIRRLEILAFFLVAIAVFYVLQGANAYYAMEAHAEKGDEICANQDTPRGGSHADRNQVQTCISSPLVRAILLSDGTWSFRMQGQGLLYDPNDLAQFLVMLIPFIWLAWRPDRRIRNVLGVLAPTALLVWGIYLTHSRSGLLALVTIVILALSGRVNWVLSFLGGALAMGAFLVLGFTGGREISVQSGSERFALWSDGLALFKDSPIFGIGFHQFRGSAGQTAHNSFLICLAELGILAYFVWLAVIVFTMFDLSSLIAWLRPKRQGLENAEPSSEGPITSQSAGSGVFSEGSNAKFERWASALRLSLAGFLVAAWFLSRAYVITLYVILGMAVTLIWIATNEGWQTQTGRKPVFWLSAVTVGIGVAIIGAIYACVRVGHYLLG